MAASTFHFLGHGANVVGSLGSGSLVQDMPSALEFNGTTTHASSSATWTGLNGATNYTVAWWQKRANNQDGRVVNANASGGEQFYMRLDGAGDATDLEWHSNLDGDDDISIKAGTLADFARDGTNWQHYACTYDGTNAYMYRNAIQIGTDTANGAVENANSEIAIGGYHAGDHTPFFSGSIRDMRIFTSGLTATQVTSVFEDIDMGGIGVTPVGWWYMEEGTGATLNDSGSANIDLGIVGGSWDKSMYNLNQIGSGSVSGTATISGGTWNLRDSTYLDFDGSGDYVSVPNNNAFNFGGGPFSVFCWANITALPGVFVFKGDLSSRNIWLNADPSGYLRGGFEKSGGDNILATGSTALNLNEWYHIGYTYDGIDTIKVFVNSVEDGSLIDSTEPDVNSDALVIGLDAPNGSAYNDGFISDVLIYDTALTQSQIDLLYAGQWDGSPVGWWKLNEGTGATVTDSGTGGNDGTITDATWVNPTYIKATETAQHLTIISGAVLSAPRGILEVSSSSVASSMILRGPSTGFVHNSGTVLNNSTAGYTATNANDVAEGEQGWIFHKWISDNNRNVWGTAGNAGSIVATFEDSMTMDGSNAIFYNKLTSGTYQFGTQTSSGSVLGTGKIRPDDGKTVIFQGANKLYPANMTIGVQTYSTTPMRLSNTDWSSYDNPFFGGTHAIPLTLFGDTKWGELTIRDGDYGVSGLSLGRTWILVLYW